MDAERASALGDVDHAVDELGDLLYERRELVDDDQQSGHRLRVRVAVEVGDVLGVVAPEDVLAMAQLGAQRLERAADEMLVEVGDEADAVRQLGAALEGGATLVVDEQERHPPRAVRRRERQYPRLQELALARSGRATDERVRPVHVQVERERVARAVPDHRAQRDAVAAQRLAGERRIARRPALDDLAGILRQIGAERRQE